MERTGKGGERRWGWKKGWGSREWEKEWKPNFCCATPPASDCHLEETGDTTEHDGGSHELGEEAVVPPAPHRGAFLHELLDPNRDGPFSSGIDS